MANTAELHSAVLDELLGEVDLNPADATGRDWSERLVEVLTSYTQVLFEHPGLARSALTARPCGEHYLLMLERLLGLLDEGGVAPAQAAWGVDVLLQVATATAAEHSTRAQSLDAEDEWNALTRALHGVSAISHPHLHALAGSLLAGSPEDRLIWCFRMQINGIANTLVPDTDRSGS